VDLYHLYYAGRERLPQISTLYSGMAELIHQTHGDSANEFTRPGGGMHPAHTLWLELRDELQDILRKSTINFWDTGEALVKTADDYARTDEEAACAFADRLDQEEDLGSFPISELPPEPDPPAPADYAPPPPAYQRPLPPPAYQRPLPPPPGEAPGEQDRSSLPPPADE
jgi:hypothetical protein